MLENVLTAFGLNGAELVPFGSGLINRTWKVSSGNRNFILQQVNTSVFTAPEKIASNVQKVGAYLQQVSPGYRWIAQLPTTMGEYLFDNYRLFPFVEGSHTITVVNDPQQAWEAAGQFGQLTALLENFPLQELQETLPDFHNLGLRYQQFLAALQNGDRARLKQSEELINGLLQCRYITTQAAILQEQHQIRKRVTHHDTKISNVLFDDKGKGMAVIDLDTLMPGFYTSDVGDMMRTYLPASNEEDPEIGSIRIRQEYFEAIAGGYLQWMGRLLAPQEKTAFVFAGKYMVYMQALRFLTDYLLRDVYYGSRYEGHNLVRASNQFQLLLQLQQHENTLERIVQKMN